MDSLVGPNSAIHRFHFLHLHLAMRRFYYGPRFGIPAESLLSTEAKVETVPWIEDPPNLGMSCHRSTKELAINDIAMPTVSPFECRICSTPPSLCLRIQELAVGGKTAEDLSDVPSSCVRFYENLRSHWVR